MEGLSQKSIDLINLSQKMVDDFSKEESRVFSMIQDGICEKVESDYKVMQIAIYRDIEKILRTHVVPPIKGRITSGKLRWRGITNILYSSNMTFLGIEQKGFIIDVKGTIKRLNK